MIEVYICILFMNGFLLMLTSLYCKNNINNLTEKIYLYEEIVGTEGSDSNKVLIYVVCPIINLITALVFSYILFSKYDNFEKTVRWIGENQSKS